MKSTDKRATKRSALVGVLAATLFLSGIAKADVVSDWNAIAVNTAITNGQNPFAQARYGAIVQLAVFEAVNSITHEYRPYLGTVTAASGASPEAAAIEAAYHVLSVYFPNSAAALNTELANSLSQIPNNQAKTDGMTAGDAAASAIIALRAGAIQGPWSRGSWRMASHAELPDCERRRVRDCLSMAEHNSIRHGKHGRFSS